VNLSIYVTASRVLEDSMICKTCSEKEVEKRAIEEELNSRDLSPKHRLKLNADLDPIAVVLKDHRIWHSNGYWSD
jgi:hypothetical protein